MAKVLVHTLIDCLTYEEYRRATRQTRVRSIVVSVIIGELAAILLCAFTNSSIWIALFLPAAALILSMVVLQIIARSYYKKNRSEFLDLNYTFDAKGVTVRRAGNSDSCRWAQIQRFDMDSKYILIYPNRSSVNIIPRRCLNPGDGNIILSLYRNAVAAQKKT